MSNGHIQPSSLDGIKRFANQIKKTNGIPHHQALNVAAQAASFENFTHARNVLSKTGVKSSRSQKHELYLTIYWQDRDNFNIGRETLRIQLSKALLELCPRSELKAVSNISWFRLVAVDHLVRDALTQSQDRAREVICKVVRELRFMEATGLRPSRDPYGRYPKGDSTNKLPKSDHGTDWYDPKTGQIILIDEPYMSAVVDDERQAWAEHHGWHLQASKWPGMYYPYQSSMFVATDASTGYDFNALMSKIDSIPDPITEEDWAGESVNDHDVFFSPLAVTSQDKRRAKAKGTIYRFSSKTTVPFSYHSSVNQRKPIAVMPIPSHQKVGRMIKAILQSPHTPWSVNSRMNSLRSKLEDWLSFECGKDYLQGPEFFDVYYHYIKDDDRYVQQASSTKGNIEILHAMKNELQKFYPDCAPLRTLTRKVDTSVNLIRKFEKRAK